MKSYPKNCPLSLVAKIAEVLKRVHNKTPLIFLNRDFLFMVICIYYLSFYNFTIYSQHSLAKMAKKNFLSPLLTLFISKKFMRITAFRVFK